MAEKKPQIVIKKITVVAGGGHGGAWKVAFADFMTAMMSFFLVMWLVSQTDPQEKKAISDYFSTPSVIEYQFSNFGAELTLEKLFLDLINEPLKTFQAFVTPMDRTPNVMSMGMKKVVMAHMADQLGSVANDVTVTADSVLFEIPDNLLFERGNSTPAAQFVSVMERVKGITTGLENTDMIITSVVYNRTARDGNSSEARDLAEQRLDLVQEKVKSSLENDTVDISGKSMARKDDRSPRERAGLATGYVRFEMRQKKVLADGSKPKPFVDGLFGKAEPDKNVYDNFVSQLSQKKARNPQSTGPARRKRGEDSERVEKPRHAEPESEAAPAETPRRGAIELPREVIPQEPEEDSAAVE